jgi:hypothetical protein
MHTFISPQHFLHILDLPHDVVHMVFSNLDFTRKVTSGLVCKQWDQLLKDGTGASRHWVVDFDVNAIVSNAIRKDVGNAANNVNNIIKRYVACAPLLIQRSVNLPCYCQTAILHYLVG